MPTPPSDLRWARLASLSGTPVPGVQQALDTRVYRTQNPVTGEGGSPSPPRFTIPASPRWGGREATSGTLSRRKTGGCPAAAGGSGRQGALRLGASPGHSAQRWQPAPPGRGSQTRLTPSHSWPPCPDAGRPLGTTLPRAQPVPGSPTVVCLPAPAAFQGPGHPHCGSRGGPLQAPLPLGASGGLQTALGPGSPDSPSQYKIPTLSALSPRQGWYLLNKRLLTTFCARQVITAPEPRSLMSEWPLFCTPPLMESSLLLKQPLPRSDSVMVWTRPLPEKAAPGKPAHRFWF